MTQHIFDVESRRRLPPIDGSGFDFLRFWRRCCDVNVRMTQHFFQLFQWWLSTFCSFVPSVTEHLSMTPQKREHFFASQLLSHFLKITNQQIFWWKQVAESSTRATVPLLARLAHGYPQGWFYKIGQKFDKSLLCFRSQVVLTNNVTQ